ncbi:hypothetical protein [Caballeronia choica]|nr:hypothetical protein [Caballeronia choica]
MSESRPWRLLAASIVLTRLASRAVAALAAEARRVSAKIMG